MVESINTVCKFTSVREEAQNFCNNLLQLAQLFNQEEKFNQPAFLSYEDTLMATTFKKINDFNLASLNNYRSQLKKPHCGFCRKNGEADFVYKSHSSHNAITGHVTCPILYAHPCELCGASGRFAHTRSYCPLATAGRIIYGDNPKYAEYFNNICAVKRTKKNSAGKRRFA